MSDTSIYTTYKSTVGNVELYINYKLLDTGYIWMEQHYYEPKYIKMFVNLLTFSINDIISKNKYKYFVQKVLIEDWNEHLKSLKTWTLLEENLYLGTVDIICPIENAIHNICSGLGWNP
jgi:hypothetical protein